MPFPVAGTFSNDAITVAGGKQALEDFLAATKALAGAATAQTVTLSGGVMTAPTTGIVKVNSTGNLDNIPITTLPAGSLLYVLAMAGQKVTIRHSIVNVLLLYGDSQYVLNNETMGILFYRNGNAWQEIKRFGIENPHVVGSGGSEPSYATGWAAGSGQSTRFFKDLSGVVTVEGRAARTTANAGLIFTLPAGYWPPSTGYGFITALGYGGGGLSKACQVTIQNNGEVSVTWLNGETFPTVDTVSFYGVRFRTTV